jgi:hypothetical protein
MGQITDYMTNVETKGLWLEPINDSTSIDASNVFFHIRQCFVNLRSSIRQPKTTVFQQLLEI